MASEYTYCEGLGCELRDTCRRYKDLQIQEDENPIFFRTHYINQLLKDVETPIAAVWDADIMLPFSQVEEAIRNVRDGCTIAYPYDGKYIILDETDSSLLKETKDFEKLHSLKLRSVFERPFCGGAFLVHKNRYIQIGGENEHFIGWGPEDAERMRRARILKHIVKWTQDGYAYHLWHPRLANSSYIDDESSVRARGEFVKICCMDEIELFEYVKSWKYFD